MYAQLYSTKPVSHKAKAGKFITKWRNAMPRQVSGPSGLRQWRNRFSLTNAARGVTRQTCIISFASSPAADAPSKISVLSTRWWIRQLTEVQTQVCRSYKFSTVMQPFLTVLGFNSISIPTRTDRQSAFPLALTESDGVESRCKVSRGGTNALDSNPLAV